MNLVRARSSNKWSTWFWFISSLCIRSHTKSNKYFFRFRSIAIRSLCLQYLPPHFISFTQSPQSPLFPRALWIFGVMPPDQFHVTALWKLCVAFRVACPNERYLIACLIRLDCRAACASQYCAVSAQWLSECTYSLLLSFFPAFSRLGNCIRFFYCTFCTVLVYVKAVTTHNAQCPARLLAHTT